MGSPEDVETFDDPEKLALLDGLPELIFVLDGAARLRWANGTARRVMGYGPTDLIGESAFDHIHPDDVNYMVASFEKRSANPDEPGLIVQGRARNQDGTWGAYEVIGLSKLDDPMVQGMVISARDISRQSALADSPARLRSMVDRTTDIVVLLDDDGRFVYANRRLTALLGHDSDNVVGKPWTVMIAPPDIDAAAAWLQRLAVSGDGASSRLRISLVGPRDRGFEVELHGTNQLADPVVNGIIVSARDVSELAAMQRELEERNRRLAHAAAHDPLTGLLNRPAFVGAVDVAITSRREARDGEAAGDVVVLFCDLDGFKAVNDQHGHEVGDVVLQEVATRIAGAVRSDDVVARYGGDEFTVLLSGDEPAHTVNALVARITGAVREPILVGSITTGVGVSVGVGRAAVHAADVDALLSAADAAMYARKRSPH